MTSCPSRRPRATSSTNLAAEPDDLRRALLDPAANDDVSDAPDPASGGVRVGDAPRDASTFDPEQFAPSPEDQLYNSRAATRRNVVVEMTFLCCVAMQAYVAVKSVAFYYAPGRVPRTVALFALTMACVNAESVALRALVASCTVRTGVLRKDFHAHELQFHDRVVGHVCDMCGLRLVAGAKGLRFGGFRCKTCDFDCCMRCFSRKNRDTAEGGIRGDRGTKSELERTPAEYLWRVMALAKLEWPLLTLAIVTTLVTSAAALFVPHFQGAAFDAAIARDAVAFDENVSALLAASAGVAVFSAFKRACFSLTGQRLNYKVRISLFRVILRQDIAYFDEQLTGTILSRLNRDADQMTTPVQLLLQNLVSNGILLVGGIGMCFHTRHWSKGSRFC